jgi:ubiquinone/menaquinone biosynthesis C-methylase UbiE
VSAGDTFRSVAAEVYDRHIGRYSPVLARSLVADAHGRALDVGCGPGALTMELVRSLGAEAVSACDPSPGFVEACRARCPGVRVELSGAESLPFADGEFDFAFAQFVVNFMKDAVAGVGEMRRVVRSGGVVRAAVWDYSDQMILLRTFWEAALALDPCAPDEGHMRYATAAELSALWEQVGLRSVAVRAEEVPASYADYDDLWSPIAGGAGPAGAYVKSLSVDDSAQLKAELRSRLGVGEGPFSLTARAWVVEGAV